MNKFLTRLVSTLCVVVLSQNVSASIDAGAASASHHFEEAAAEVHEHLHHNYGSSYGSHDLQERGNDLHSVLHDWSHGEATEADVVIKMDALKLDWNSFRQSIIPAGVLDAGDDTLDELYEIVKDTYKEVRFLLRKAK